MRLRQDAVIGIDPGQTQSALVELLDGGHLGRFALAPNEQIEKMLATLDDPTLVAIELTPPYTMQASVTRSPFFPRQVLDTAMVVGRFQVRCELEAIPWRLISRRDVKRELLGQSSGTDTDVIHCLLEVFGFSSIAAAKGTAKAPGPFYGLKRDLWQALAVAEVARMRLSSGASLDAAFPAR